MPVQLPPHLRRLDQAEFGSLAYDVMKCVFEIHNDLGRFFDERIYKRELQRRYSGVELEVPIHVVHRTFSKPLYLDVLVHQGGLFEFKAAEAIVPRHRNQLLQYQLLAEIDHAQLVNMRPEQVEHEFSNATAKHKDRVSFAIDDSAWNKSVAQAGFFAEVLVELLRDWGTGLDLQLYEEAVTHFLGGESRVLSDIVINASGRTLGSQSFRLAAPRIAFKLTAFESQRNAFEEHAHRLLRYSDLDAILWANIALRIVTLKVIRSGSARANER
ncbi:MAG: GxxExxY protein [Verrucomicrobiota bacterium]